MKATSYHQTMWQNTFGHCMIFFVITFVTAVFLTSQVLAGDPAVVKNGVFEGYRHEVKDATDPAWFHKFDKQQGSGLTLPFFHVKFSSHLENGKAILYLTKVRVSSGFIARWKKTSLSLYQPTFVHEATHAAQHLRALTLLAQNFKNDAAEMKLLYEPVADRIKIYEKKTHIENEKLAKKLGNWLHELYSYYLTQGNKAWFEKAKKDAKITATSTWRSAIENGIKFPASETEAYYRQFQFDSKTMNKVFQRDFSALAKTGTVADQAVNGFPGKTNMTEERTKWPGRWELKSSDGSPTEDMEAGDTTPPTAPTGLEVSLASEGDEGVTERV